MSMALIKSLLAYDPETGIFTRLGSSGGRPEGSVAGSLKSNGYIYLSVDGKRVLAHRAAWFMVHGEIPEFDIDHIDGDRTNNRIANLRKATRAENMQNERKARANNLSSGLLGVSFSKAAGRWMAGIRIAGRRKYLGLFDTPELAHQAYLNAKRANHPFFMH